MKDYRILNVILQKQEVCVAVVEVMAFEKLILRFKIVPKKDGSSQFPCTASLKIVEDQQDRWAPAFMLDSNYERDELHREIMNAYRSHYQPRTTVVPNYGEKEEPLPF